ncbi:MAG TPA: DHHA1 domain-containing protein, partial [Fimbriimonadaceae bacterium]|nr:DHHA1 domain-containing protein [Fimbriimonadaceae bacterium]
PQSGEGVLSLVGLSVEQIRPVLDSGLFFGEVHARVDAERRRRITRNHTATHLLHAALRQVLGKHVTQAGSLVAPDHLRFDFTHGKAMTSEEIAEVESIVNREVLAGLPVQIHSDLPIEEAKKKGAMALFGEKYGDRVRMVQVGDFSLELCGGCHIRQSSEVGLFKILSESSAASGVRRIEALTGEGAYEWVREQSQLLHEAARRLKANPHDLPQAVERTLEQLREERKRAGRMRAQAAETQEAALQQVGPVELAVQSLDEGDMKDATLAADRLAEGQPKRVAVVALRMEGKAMIICKVGAEAQAAGAHAGNLVRELAKLAGGGGGGRPDFATAGAKDLTKLNDALEAAPAKLAEQLGAAAGPAST